MGSESEKENGIHFDEYDDDFDDSHVNNDNSLEIVDTTQKDTHFAADTSHAIESSNADLEQSMDHYSSDEEHENYSTNKIEKADDEESQKKSNDDSESMEPHAGKSQ